MATPLGMTQQLGMSAQGAPVSKGLQQTVWESEVAVESVQYDPMLSSTVKLTDTIEVTDQASQPPMGMIVMELTDKNKAARSVVKPLLMALSGAGVMGTGTEIGHEENRQLKYVSAYAHDYKHGVALDDYGINAREISPYGIVKATKRDLARWRGELFGKFMRQAFCEGRSSNLTSAPVSQPQYMSPNVYIPSVSDSSQVTPHNDDTSNGGTAQTQSSLVGSLVSTTTAANMRLTVPRIIALEKFARISRYITPIMVDKKMGYVLFTHPDEIQNLRDTSVTNSWSSLLRDGRAMNDALNVLPTLQFCVGNIFVCEDPRAPTCVFTGTSTSGYLGSFGYVGQGRADGRTTAVTANAAMNVNILAGEDAIAFYEPEPFHFENQLDSYKQNDNIGVFGAAGFCRVDYNVDTSSDSRNNDSTNGSNRGAIPTIENVSSMLVLTQRY